MLRPSRAPALLALLAALGGPSAAAQTAATPLPVQITMDTGSFRYSDAASLVEIYLSVGAASLRYTRAADGSFETSLPLHVTVRPVAASAPAGAATAAAYDQTLDYRFSVADTAGLGAGQVFTEQIRTSLAPGEYEVAVAVASAAERAGSEARSDLSVPDYGTGAMLSSVQLARRIARSTDESNPFVKSGRIVQPHPAGFYGGDLPRVTYYAEAYGVPMSTPTYTVLTFLTPASGVTPIEGTQTRTERPVQPVDVIVGAVDVSALPTSQYTLHVVLLNAANEALAEQTKRVFVINPDVPQPNVNVAIAADDELLYAAMPEEELELNVQHARVIANSRERSDLNALRSDDERRAYLVRFWRNRSQESGTDARRTFYDRLTRTNERYRYGQTPGFRTDRGRVYLTYGQPTDVDRQTVNTNSAGFERWTYDNIPGEGLAEFVFVDRYSSGQLELVHSSVRGEVSLPDWQDELRN